jgi:transposase
VIFFSAVLAANCKNACIRLYSGGRTEIRTAVFGTFTRDLEALRDWLRQHQVRQVAMESTGVYWIPVWNVLEQSEDPLELTLVNPQHTHALRGHKTDRQDAGRIAECSNTDSCVAASSHRGSSVNCGI